MRGQTLNISEGLRAPSYKSVHEFKTPVFAPLIASCVQVRGSRPKRRPRAPTPNYFRSLSTLRVPFITPLIAPCIVPLVEPCIASLIEPVIAPLIAQLIAPLHLLHHVWHHLLHHLLHNLMHRFAPLIASFVAPLIAPLVIDD